MFRAPHQLTFLLALFATAPTLQKPFQSAGGAVQREAELREIALWPERSSWEYDATTDWRERYDALEALGRAAPSTIGEPQRAFAEACLSDAHPNVRGSALLVFARHGLELPADPHAFEEDPLPAIRADFARALAHSRGEVGDEILLRLAHDADVTVAAEARVQLLGRGPASAVAQAQLFELGPEQLDALAFLDALDALEDSPISTSMFLSVHDHFARASTTEANTSDIGARRALWKALAMVKLHGPTRPASQGEVAGAGMRLMAEHWFSPLTAEDSSMQRRREDRLQRAATSSMNSALARVLFERARELESVALAGLLEKNRLEVLVGEVETLRRVAIESLLHARSFDPFVDAFLPDVDWSRDLVVWTFDQAASRKSRWSEGASDFLFSEDFEVSAAACEALLDTWQRTGDSVTGEMLCKALWKPELCERIYRNCVGSWRGVPSEELFARWWKVQTPEKQLDLLRSHARGKTYAPWREGLINFWASGLGRTPSIPELLAASVNDAEVRERLHEWLRAEITRLEASEVPLEETTRGPWREAEAYALWLVKAWVAVAGADHVEQKTELLLRVGQLGKELSKVLVADLAKSAEGRAALTAILNRAELSRRNRLEILLVNKDLKTSGELLELFVAYATCDEELKLRILERARGLDHELVRALLLEALLVGNSSASLRQTAVASLATTGAPQVVVPLLARVLAETGDFELKRAAIAALGDVAVDHEVVDLRVLFADESNRKLLGDELLPALVRIELRGQGHLSAELTQLWRERVSAQASSELASRFRGERLPAREFVYKGWLAAAEALAEAGALERALGDGWWSWDARLLMQLANTVREITPAEFAPFVRTLDRAALVALLGEGDAPDRSGLIVQCRARLLNAALLAHDWREAHGWVQVMLDDWRSGRTTPNAVQSIFGSHDRDSARDPLHRLLTLEAVTRGWSALQRADLAGANELAQEANRRRGDSAAARQYVAELMRAIAQADK